MPDFKSDNTINKVDLLGFEELQLPEKEKNKNKIKSRISELDSKNELKKNFK